MKIGYLWIPHFRLVVEFARRPDLIGRPVIVGGLPTARKPVLDASGECRRSGIRPGMTLRQAAILCPDALFLPDAPESIRRAHDGLLDVLGRFSPSVESIAAGAAALDLSGLEALFGPDSTLAQRILAALQREMGLSGRLGIAPTRLVAALAARTAPDGGWVAVDPAHVDRFLAPLPVSLLPLDPTSRSRLEALGIQTIEQLMRLPGHALPERIGQDAYEMHRALGGYDRRSVQPQSPPDNLTAALSFETPLQTRQHLQVVAEQLLAELVGALDARHQACRLVRLGLQFGEGDEVEESMVLKTPTAAIADLLAAVLALADRIQQREVERMAGTGDGTANEPAAGPLAIRITLGDLGAEAFRQLPLLQTRPDLARRRERLERAVGRIERRYGNRLRRGAVDALGRYQWEDVEND